MSKQLTRYVNEKHTQEECIGFIAGYKQAKSETMFSLEDIEKAIGLARIDDGGETFSSDEIIQSITKPKEYEFVVEMEEVEEWSDEGGAFTTEQPKIINGKVLGKWIIK